MSTPRDNTYYYPNSGRLQSKSPTRGDTQSGSSVPEQGRRTILPPLTLAFPTSHSPGLFSYVNSMYINSDLKSTDVAPSTYASHYTQQRHPQPYDAGYASYPCESSVLSSASENVTDAAQDQAPSQQHQASQYSMYQQQPDPRYAAQQTYTTYPSRTSPPIPADHHRHIPSHAHQPVRDDRWQAQSASYYPQPTSSPQTMTSHSTVRSPQAAYPTQYPQYQPVATSTYPTDPNASRTMAHGQPVASQHHHMQMGHPSVERTVSSRNVASLPYSRGPPVMSPIDYDTAESSAEPTIKKKRKRADPHQLKILNDVYARTAFPSTEERADLAKRLDMSARSVQIWLVHSIWPGARSHPFSGSKISANQ